MVYSLLLDILLEEFTGELRPIISYDGCGKPISTEYEV